MTRSEILFVPVALLGFALYGLATAAFWVAVLIGFVGGGALSITIGIDLVTDVLPWIDVELWNEAKGESLGWAWAQLWRIALACLSVIVMAVLVQAFIEWAAERLDPM